MQIVSNAGKDGEHRTELNEPFREEVDVVLGRRGFLMETTATKETKRLTHATVHPSYQRLPQQPIALRCQGPWVPSPSYTGVFGAPPFLCTDATHAVTRVPVFCGS